MNPILQANLAALAQRNPGPAAVLARSAPSPEADIRPSRRGQPCLRVGKAQLTSTVDPVAEGLAQAQAAPGGPLLALGFGLGYHLEPLAERDVLVWEPDAAVLAAALAARDMSAWLGKLRLTLEQPSPEQSRGRRVFAHQATARLHPRALAAVTRKAPPPPRPRADAPKVLVVPPVMGGSLPVAVWCAEAFSALGCRAGLLPMHCLRPSDNARREEALRPMMKFLAEITLLAVEDQHPDLCFMMAQAPLTPGAVGRIRAGGTKTAFWFIENFRLLDYFREVAPHYDHFFHIQGEALESELEGLGVAGSHLPVAAHPPRHRPMTLSQSERRDYAAPVGFMGSGAYPNRRHIFEQLLSSGLELRIWGSEWPK